MAAYASAGQRAFGEVENALAAEFALNDREAILQANVRDNERALELAQTQVRVGSADRRAVEQRQLALHSPARRCCVCRANAWRGRVDLRPGAAAGDLQRRRCVPVAAPPEVRRREGQTSPADKAPSAYRERRERDRPLDDDDERVDGAGARERISCHVEQDEGRRATPPPSATTSSRTGEARRRGVRSKRAPPARRRSARDLHAWRFCRTGHPVAHAVESHIVNAESRRLAHQPAVSLPAFLLQNVR